MATSGSGARIPTAIHSVTNRLAHYKAEEEKLITEWRERSMYGEVVPSLDEER